MATNEPIETARVKFGNVLRFHREQRSHTTRRVADMCGVSREAIENFEAGHVVPDGKTWDKYKGIVNKRLAAYGELRGRALKEAEAERALLINSMEHRKMATANGANGHTTKPPSPPLAHKPFAALVGITAPPPDARTVNPGQEVAYHDEPPSRSASSKPYDARRAQRTKEALAKLPKGWKQTEQVNKRRELALTIIRQRPHINEGGPDGLQEILRRTFGVGLSESFTKELREQVRRELECEHKPTDRPSLQPTPAAVQEAIDTGKNPSPAAREILAASQRQAIPIPVVATDPAENISAAVSLVLDAIPNLRSFTIDVDDNGEAQVNYTMREVKVIETGGSLKVKR